MTKAPAPQLYDGEKIQIEGVLPAGVELLPLHNNQDLRGDFTEIFRSSWLPELQPCQWNLVSSEADVLRGVHVHLHHSDYLVLVAGECTFGLYDCRRGSPTEFRSAQVVMRGCAGGGLFIPPGVAHGFCFPVAAVHVYAVSHYWNPVDELGCRYDDPDLGIAWPVKQPKVSTRDSSLSSLREMVAQVPSYTLTQKS